MPTYEAMFIFRPGLTEDEQKALSTEVENILKANQATVENTQVFGRRSLAYEIKKCKEGLYYLVNFSAPSGVALAKIQEACNIEEKILRVLILKKTKH